MSERDAATTVRELLAQAGGPGYHRCLADLERLGDIGCDELFALRNCPADIVVGIEGANPRAVAQDVWHAFVVAARRWPDRFLSRVLADPIRHDNVTILDALGEVDRPAARALLIAAVKNRRAMNRTSREYALRSLCRLRDPHVPDLLVRLVKDRGPSMRFAAVEAAIHHGDARLLPALHKLAEAGKDAGTRDYARLAIEAITARRMRPASFGQ